MNPYDEFVERLHPLEIAILNQFKTKSVFSQEELSIASGVAVPQLRTAVEWLLVKELITSDELNREEIVTLTEQGRAIAENGFPEGALIKALQATPEGIKITEVPEKAGISKESFQTAMGALKKSKTIAINAGLVTLTDAAILSNFEERLKIFKKIAQSEKLLMTDLNDAEKQEVIAGFKKRTPDKGFFKIDEKIFLQYEITKTGSELLPHLKLKETINMITPEMLASGKWRNGDIRKYNIKLNPSKLLIGKKHPYRIFLDEVRSKLTSLGFKEMTGSLVESEFWDMDALFMPQFHAARNIHDVYFLKDPKEAQKIEEPFLSAVTATHEDGGGTGSKGWGYKFDLERTKKLVMRSQGTAISARTLASKPEIPSKYFAVARCFRYDQIDATHGTDFFQVEGIAIDPNINFVKLLGLLKLFAKTIAGVDEVRFTPAYFPFTEPSVEMHARHPQLGYIELGGAGIFRTEVTHPLGIDVPVIAWGLGIDRMAMLALGINDIRQLFTHDLEFLRESKVV